MKTLFLTLTLFALGCYAQQPVQYVPQQAAPVAPPPTIIEVPKDQPQPQRPIIITPFGDRHRDFRHGTNEPAPATKSGADNNTAPLDTFVNATVQLPHEILVELPAPPQDVATSQSTTIDANQPAVSSQSTAQSVERKKPTIWARIAARLAARAHRAAR